MQTNQTICFFNTVMTWGGGEKWHLDVAHYLHGIGQSVIVYVSPRSELSRRAESLGLQVRELKISKFSYLNGFKVRRLASYYRIDMIDTVILNLSSDMKIGALAARNENVRRVIYRRGSAIPIKNTWINRSILRHCVTDILANSQSTVETIFENNADIFDRDRVTVIPNGIAIPAQEQLKKIEPSHQLRIGNVGRLYKQKAQHYLIDLAMHLKENGVDFVIQIVGEGVERQRLTDLIEANDLDDCVKLLGFKDTLEEFYQSLDVFILTSVWEGFGYVIAEAMSYGVPAIAFDVSSNPELIADGSNGHLVPLGNVVAIANSIQLIMKDRERYSKSARQSVVDKYAKPNVLERIQLFLEP